MTTPVLVEPQQGWWRITLNRPERLNAFDAGMQSALLETLARAERDRTCRAVVLTGAGRAFSAGQDLEAVRGETDLGRILEEQWNPLIRRLAGLAVPTVAALNGIAAGAGASVALACDVVVAARSSRILMGFSRIGLVPDSGASWHLPRLIGAARARAVALLCEAVTATEAESWGLIWKAVDDDALADEASAIAQRLADGPTAALIATRAALAAGLTSTLEAQLDQERDLQRAAGRHPDYAEGVAAFLERRAPRFGERA
ncbi:MAG: enoyl-CoA hydratase-related protein [Acetobacteraceae bacterium]